MHRNHDLDDAPCIYAPSNSWRVLDYTGDTISEHINRESAEACFSFQQVPVFLVDTDNNIVKHS